MVKCRCTKIIQFVVFSSYDFFIHFLSYHILSICYQVLIPYYNILTIMSTFLNHTKNFFQVDEDEMEDAKWFRRPEIVQMLTHQHPQGLYIPPEQAIAHQIIKSWVRNTASANLQESTHASACTWTIYLILFYSEDFQEFFVKKR